MTREEEMAVLEEQLVADGVLKCSRGKFTKAARAKGLVAIAEQRAIAARGQSERYEEDPLQRPPPPNPNKQGTLRVEPAAGLGVWAGVRYEDDPRAVAEAKRDRGVRLNVPRPEIRAIIGSVW